MKIFKSIGDNSAVIDRLLTPYSLKQVTETFFANKPAPWVSQTTTCRRIPFDMQTLKSILGSGAVRNGDLVIYDDRTVVTEKDIFNSTGHLNKSVLLKAFSGGVAFKIRNVNRFNENLENVCRELTIALSAPIEATLHAAPKRSSGISPSFDPYGVLLFQVHGAQQWLVHEVDNEDTSKIGDPGEFYLVNENELLCLPRGKAISALSPDKISVYLTFRVLTPTWGDVIERLVPQLLAKQTQFRRPLPFDRLTSVTDNTEFYLWELKRLLDDGLHVDDVEEALDGIDSASLLCCNFPGTIEITENAPISDETELWPTEGQFFVIRKRNGANHLISYFGGQLSVNGLEANVWAQVLDKPGIKISELAEHGLSSAEIQGFVTSLFSEGLLDIQS